VQIDGVTITGGNLPAAAAGGGIGVNGGATLDLSNSTVAGNSAGNAAITGDGGGIGLSPTIDSTLNLTNVTVSGNSATGSGGGIDTGVSTHVTLDNVTIAGNTGNSDVLNGGAGGGINRPTVTPRPLTVHSSIIAGNRDNGGTAPDCRGFGVGPTLPTLSSNLIGDPTGCGYVPGPGDLVGVDPQIGPLASNGGASQTHALLAGSPALDVAVAPCPAMDQRGVSRPQGTSCDIGAFELEVAHPPVTPQRKCKKHHKKKHHRAAASKKKHKKKGCKRKRKHKRR
jgi:predicted outer membrane repeat protein